MANLNTIERCQKATLKFDLYKQPFRLLLPDEKDEYRTFAGALLTIVTVITVVVYASLKLVTLFDYNDYKVQIRHFDDFYDMEERLTMEHGLMIAGGIAGQPNIPENIGAVNFYRKTYSPSTNLTFTKLETRACTKEDFDIGGKGSKNATFFGTYKS